VSHQKQHSKHDRDRKTIAAARRHVGFQCADSDCCHVDPALCRLRTWHPVLPLAHARNARAVGIDLQFFAVGRPFGSTRCTRFFRTVPRTVSSTRSPPHFPAAHDAVDRHLCRSSCRHGRVVRAVVFLLVVLQL